MCVFGCKNVCMFVFVVSVEDYSLDVSLTEDEREEKSYKIILPSESHRKKGKHHHLSDNESVTSEGIPSPT